MLRQPRKIFATLLAVLVLLSSSAMAASLVTVTMPESSFDIRQLDSKMTLSDALNAHPEIYDTFFIAPISDEEAHALIAQGEPVINTNDISASAFLSSLSARKTLEEQTSNDRYVIGNQSKASSSYGAAWSYISKTGTRPNCYGYAIGISSAYNPGGLSTGFISSGASLSTIITKINSDMAAAFNGGAREISTNTTSIYSYEWRIALRTGSALLWNGSYYESVWDYHFWLQTSTGTRCHKPGQLPSQHLGAVTPHTANWPLMDANGRVVLANFYNSTTKYLAVFSA